MPTIDSLFDFSGEPGPVLNLVSIWFKSEPQVFDTLQQICFLEGEFLDCELSFVISATREGNRGFSPVYLHSSSTAE